MHQALYRKYRPATFDDVWGQKHITDVLRFETENNKISHAYLFCGSRGTGKTSCAKIMAKAVNCEAPVNGSPCLKCRSCLDIEAGTATDVVEMDAASHNGVDEIRALCDDIMYTPAMLKYRVYIIDEVHMLSQGAFNALLKTIEEPPEHAVFILATTELHKVPSTIVSRCQRFGFNRINMRVIADRLKYIAEKENIVLEDEASLLIARQAQGGMRDAIGLFELCSAGGADVTAAKVTDALGISGYDLVCETMTAAANRDMKKLFGIIADVSAGAKDVAVFWQELISFTRDMLVSKYSENSGEYLDLTESETEELKKTAGLYSLSALVYASGVLDDAFVRMSRSPQTKRLTAEMALLKLCRPELDSSPAALEARISKLEDAVAVGSFSAAQPSDAQAGVITHGANVQAQSDHLHTETDSERNSSLPGIIAEGTTFGTTEGTTEGTTFGTTEGTTFGSTKDSTKGTAKNPADSTADSISYSVSGNAADKSADDSGFAKITDISEAVGKLDGADRALASFLTSATPYVSADRTHILLEADSFCATMLGRDEAKKAVTLAFAKVGLAAANATVEIKVKPRAAKKVSPADELGGLL